MEVAGELLLGERRIEDAVHHHAVGRRNEADHRASVALRAAEKFDKVKLVDRVLGRISHSERIQVILDFIVVVHLEELKVGRRFQKLRNPFRLLDSGKLQKNLSVLVLKLLDVGSHYAELVDTRAEDVECSVNLAVHLLLKSRSNLSV